MVLNLRSHLSPPLLDLSLLLLLSKLASKLTLASYQISLKGVRLSMEMMPLNSSSMDKLLTFLAMSMLLVESGITWMDGAIVMITHLLVPCSTWPTGH